MNIPHNRFNVKYRPLGDKVVPHDVKAVKYLSTLCTCISNFGAQYNFQSIAVALLTMSTAECTSTPDNCSMGHQQAWVVGTSAAVAFLGAICGQLSMGALGDHISRNGALSVTLSISVLAVALSAILPTGHATSVYSTIVVCRFFVGVGLGGIFPLSSTKASEDSASTDSKTNSSGSAFAFFWQIPGLISPWLLGWILSFSALPVGARWRLLLGLGSLPLAVAILCLLLESNVKKENIWCRRNHPNLTAREETRSEAQPAARESFIAQLREHGNWNKLLVSGGAWFLYDVIFYGLSLLGGTVIHAMHTVSDDDVSSRASMRRVCSQQTMALALGLLPMAFNLYLLPRLSLKYLLVVGFLAEAFFLLLFACLFSFLRSRDTGGLFALYCLTLMSLQLGVPVATYALPAALFEKRSRCTFSGVASAMGKIGAIVGAYSFYYVALVSMEAVLAICVVVALLGAYAANYYIADSALLNDDSTKSDASAHGGIEMSDAGTELDVSMRTGSVHGGRPEEQPFDFSPVSFE